MTHNDVIENLSAYIEGDLDSQTSAAISEHLRTCASCRTERDATVSLRTRLRSLPASAQPRKDLWEGIAGATTRPVASPRRDAIEMVVTAERRWSVYARIAALFLTGLGGFLWTLPGSEDGWSVVHLAGDPRVDGYVVERRGLLTPGSELVTGANGTAEVAIADIGTALVLPDSRLRLVGTSPEEHRMYLALGSIQASVWSPPRVFVVETPTAVAYDLGCAYDLAVDSTGASRLLVSSGEVSLETPDRVSIVLAGYVCETLPGFGPGTPYLMESSPELIALLRTLDSGEANVSTARRLARIVTRDDAVTLVHLLMRTRGGVFDLIHRTLANFHEPPSDVTKERLLSRDREAFEKWLNSFAYRIVPLDTNVQP